MPAFKLSQQELPFPPGKSPFHIKGSAYRDSREVIEAVPGGERAFDAAFQDPELLSFLKQRFLANQWYDLFPLIVRSYVVAKLHGRKLEDYLRERGRVVAQRDLTGMYRILLTVVSPGLVAEKLPRFYTQYYDFGGVVIRRSAPNYVELLRTGMPAATVDWFAALFAGYLEATMLLAGARAAEVVSRAPVPAGRAHGLELVDVPITIHWA